ncbi:phage tail protein [Photorhabdus luminescens]|uniref:phage tail protein n=1 Tax=Photorhabdus luminescens TaxID=29488 RepID=UPI0020CC62D5|nr:tail fiber protein [Photorhabdus luminescens]
MNHKNDFKAFSINNNANVVSQERYEESRSLKTGFPPDNITVHLLNKVLRQSSTITSVLANFIATYSGNDVLDNGDIVKLTAQLNGALEQKIATEVPNASLTQKGVTQLTDKTGNSNTLAVTQKLVSDVNDNANSRLSKKQNGADVPDKNAFVKNLGLSETVNKANNAVPSSRKINGKVLTGDVSLNAGNVGAFPNVVSVNDIPGRGFIGPFSGEKSAYWAKGINIGQSGDVGQIYVTSSGVLHAYFLNSNGDVAGGAIGGYPVGAPIPWPLPNVPAGYIACNGQAFNKTVYTRLAEIYPNGRLPDLRGEFIRGWDDSRGVDMGRGILTWQGDAIRNITGALGDPTAESRGSATGAFSYSYSAGGRAAGSGGGRVQWTFDASRVVPTANENRPRNIAFNYIVRAA